MWKKEHAVWFGRGQPTRPAHFCFRRIEEPISAENHGDKDRENSVCWFCRCWIGKTMPAQNVFSGFVRMLTPTEAACRENKRKTLPALHG